MLGWHISVHRQADGGAHPARADSKTAARIAVWQTGLHGMDWLGDTAGLPVEARVGEHELVTSVRNDIAHGRTNAKRGRDHLP